MDRRVSPALILFVVIALTACSSEEAGETVPSAEGGDPSAVATTPATPQAAETGGAEGAVVAADAVLHYQAVYDGVVDVGVVRADGSEPRRLPGGPGNRWHPDWSPDGSEIVYDHQGTDEAAGIGVVGVEGGDDRTVVPCVDPCVALSHPAWSPDGGRIAYVGVEGPTEEYPEGVGYLGLHDLSADEQRRVLDTADPDFAVVSGNTPSFSPDGQQVVLGLMREDGDWSLATVALADGALAQVTDWGLGARPDWSPDGEWIVFQETENEPPSVQPGVGLYRVRPDGSGLEQLTEPEDAERDYYPRWLPDGSGILYSRCTSASSCETRLMAGDGTDDRSLFGELGEQTVHVALQP